jgi:hypothetical protein
VGGAGEELGPAMMGRARPLAPCVAAAAILLASNGSAVHGQIVLQGAVPRAAPRPTSAPAETCPKASDLDVLLEIVNTKTQFETTAEFERRAQGEIKKRLPQLRTDGAFCEFDGRLKYDAEKRVVKLELGVTDAITLSAKRDVIGRFTAQNAFGVTREVTQSRSETAKIQFTGRLDLGSVGFPMSPKDAEAQLPDLKIGITADVVAPFARREHGTISATITAPYETQYDWRDLLMRAKRIVLFNTRTRAIVHDYPVLECKSYGRAVTRVGTCQGM